MRAVVAVAGLLGGLCWIAAYAVEDDLLTWAGAALLAVAALGAGAGLVSRSATWLRVLVALCFLALVGSVVEVLRDADDPLLVDAILGGVAVVVAVAALLRQRRRCPTQPTAAPSHVGRHAR